MKWFTNGLLYFKCRRLKNAKMSAFIIKYDPILNMTPKQVTHVRICERLLLIAQHISQLLKNSRIETQVESPKMSAVNK